MDFNILRAWIVWQKQLLLFWVVSYGRMSLALCLILLRTIIIIDVWVEGSLYVENPSIPVSVSEFIWGTGECCGWWYGEVSAW